MVKLGCLVGESPMLASFGLSFGKKVVTCMEGSFNLLPGGQVASILEPQGMERCGYPHSQFWNPPGLHMIPTLRYCQYSPSSKILKNPLQRLALPSFARAEEVWFALVCRNREGFGNLSSKKNTYFHLILFC